ncbi:hypothetical protein [Vibrio tritonius]|uniref:hypothetical protein n=1 Tax=Vibrio tritonius TaxID=1435069 RepID=UPI000AA8F897|nr:hypothetical protein [Vibrio tritonius]
MYTSSSLVLPAFERIQREAKVNALIACFRGVVMKIIIVLLGALLFTIASFA